VLLAFSHEPEGDGNLPDWVRMQRHLAPIVHARTSNVAYTVIFSAWNVLLGPANEALAKLWPGSQYVDLLGIDVYNYFGTYRGRDGGKVQMDPSRYFDLLGSWTRAHGVPWAIGETAYTASSARNNPNWLQNEFNTMLGQGGRGFTYFDSSKNSIADWTLSDTIRRAAFRTLLSRSARIC
jgi:hypothetical protein